jgi:hypothetical protein
MKSSVWVIYPIPFTAVTRHSIYCFGVAQETFPPELCLRFGGNCVQRDAREAAPNNPTVNPGDEKTHRQGKKESAGIPRREKSAGIPRREEIP